MFSNVLRAMLAAFLLVFAIEASAGAEPPPLEAYGDLPEVEDAAISPSGNNVAVLVRMNGTRMLVFLGPGNALIRQLTVGDVKIRYFDWIGDDRVMLVRSQTEDLRGFTTDKAEVATAQVIPVTFDGPIQTIFGSDRRLANAVFGDYGIRRIDGRWVAFFGTLEFRRDGSAYSFDHGRPFLYATDIEKDDNRRIASPTGAGTSRDWLVDRNGRVAATLDIDRTNGRWEIRGPDNDWLVEGRQSAGRVGLIGLGFGGATAIYSERGDDDVTRWHEVPLAGGAPHPFLEGAGFERLYFAENTGHLLGYLDSEGRPVFADPEHQEAAAKIMRAFAGRDMRMVDWTPDFGKVLVRTSGNGDSGSWFTVDLATLRADGFGVERRLIPADQVGPISTIEYTASDGLEMDGILTLPPGRAPENLPVILLPHGGPHAEDREQFDWWAQAFASRGYAVFQPNFRGSTNRSQKFKSAGYGEWGRKMQTDISDGLSALAERGIVDPDRACIMGASYGGYAALAGVTLQQGIYRCAVAVAPVTDLKAMYEEDYRASGERRVTKTALLEQLGPRSGWDEVSPRRLADRADAPVMLIHGEDDTVVPFSHSYKMADALKDADRPYELVTLDGEDHWLSLSATRRQMLESAMRFIQEHNPPD